MTISNTDSLSAVFVGIMDSEIMQLEFRLRAAQLSADIEELSALISENLLFAGPDGSLGGKSQDIEAYRSGLVRFLRHEPIELQIHRLTNDVAVTYLLTQLSVSVGGAINDGVFRYTRVWHREADGTWRVGAGQVSQTSR